MKLAEKGALTLLLLATWLAGACTPFDTTTQSLNDSLAAATTASQTLNTHIAQLIATLSGAN